VYHCPNYTRCSCRWYRQNPCQKSADRLTLSSTIYPSRGTCDDPRQKGRDCIAVKVQVMIHVLNKDKRASLSKSTWCIYVKKTEQMYRDPSQQYTRVSLSKLQMRIAVKSTSNHNHEYHAKKRPPHDAVAARTHPRGNTVQGWTSLATHVAPHGCMPTSTSFEVAAIRRAGIGHTR
jgi:hypothetical protein